MELEAAKFQKQLNRKVHMKGLNSMKALQFKDFIPKANRS